MENLEEVVQRNTGVFNHIIVTAVDHIRKAGTWQAMYEPGVIRFERPFNPSFQPRLPYPRWFQIDS